MASFGTELGMTAMTAAIDAPYKVFNAFLPKAQLYVPKPKSIAEANVAAVASSVTGKNDCAALAALNKLTYKDAYSAVSSGVMGKVKQAMGHLPVYGFIAAKTTQSASTASMMLSSGYQMMEVMYNPKSINISGTGGGEVRGTSNGDAGISQLSRSSRVSRLKFNVELVFEDIDINDAFPMEKFQANAESALDLAASIAQQKLLGGFSVQDKCDGLLALLNFKRLKQVVFLWGNMFFHGELTNVDVRYEMFNYSGDPILAKVRLQIEQSDSQSSIKYAADENQWSQAVDIAFNDLLF